jgi:hypothetical protein
VTFPLKDVMWQGSFTSTKAPPKLQNGLVPLQATGQSTIMSRPRKTLRTAAHAVHFDRPAGEPASAGERRLAEADERPTKISNMSINIDHWLCHLSTPDRHLTLSFLQLPTTTTFFWGWALCINKQKSSES